MAIDRNIPLSDPQPKQVEFLTANTRYIAYGGARGGGKSWALRYKLIMLCLKNKGINCLLIRRTYAELEVNHISVFRKLLPKEIATYGEQKKLFTFGNGSTIKFGYMDTDSDTLQYQGQEFDIIAVDEATQLTEFQFNTLKACLRGANDFPKRFYLTCNPGGVGHEWVKRLFIDREYRIGEKVEDYTFISAKVYDNPALINSDQGYVDMLNSLPDEMKRAWLNGEWDVFDGQFFRCFDEHIHVVPADTIPTHYMRYMAFDYGLDMLAVVWGAVDEDGRMTVYRELQCPNLVVADAAKAILEANGDDVVDEIYAPPDLWARVKDSGKSMIELFRDNGIDAIKANANRVQGWQVVLDMMRPQEDGVPNIRIMANCRDLIRNIPLLQHDERNVNDVSTQPHNITHITDALRYLCMARFDAAEPLPVEHGEGYKYINQMIKNVTPKRRKRF